MVKTLQMLLNWSIGNISLVLGSRIERANRGSGVEIGMDSTEAIGDGGRPLDSAHATQTVNTKIMGLENKRAAVKRRITNTLKKLDSTIEQYGRKAIIRGYVNNLQEYLIEAKGLNDVLVSVIPENEHETALDWYEEQLERVQEAKYMADAHLDERAEESSSGLILVIKIKLKQNFHNGEILASSRNSGKNDLRGN